MKKKILISFIFYLFSFISIQAEQNFAYIDIDFLFSNSTKGKEIINSLNTINKKNFEEISINEKKIAILDKEINLKKNILSKNETQNMIDELNQLILETNKKKKELLNNFEKKKNDEIQNFFSEIRPIIDNYMKKNSINIIFDKKNIFMANKNHDITLEILELILN